VVASILPEDFDSEDTSNLSKEEKESVLHNCSITNLMYNNVSKVIREFIFNNEDICNDAHHIWVALKDMYTSADDEDEEESLEECSTSTSCIPPLKTSSTKQKSDNIVTTTSDQANSVALSSELGGTGFGSDQHQLASSNFRAASHKPIEVSTAPSTSLLCTNNSKSQVTKGRRKKGSEVEQFDFKLDKMTKKDKKNVLELIKRVRRQEDELTRQQAYRDSFEEKMKKLEESNDVLSRKCKENITKAYACATNSLSCAASLEKENQTLKDQLEEITCKFVKLQGTHIELEYSHERLVESHTLLEVANEVLVNSVKSYTPHCTTSTCTQVKNDISCANPCDPKGKPSWYDQVIVESCDDFITQENDDLMQEV
jgi:hypothetical protein